MLTLRNSGSDADRDNSLSKAPGSSLENQAIDLVHPSQTAMEQTAQRLYAAISLHPHHSDTAQRTDSGDGVCSLSRSISPLNLP
ncbi:hypothetical protein ACN92M_17705 [Paenibacillus polymyxa]|uniref:hypothetical protein n=1 Tax=Paenibacillus polymyxa TaxID=1406 RepID=UPI003B58F3E3